MKIGIVLHPYGEDKPAGLARIIFELAREMIAGDRENEYIIFLKHQPKIFPVFLGDNWKIKVIGSGIFWLDRLRKFPRADVYVFNTPALPLFSKPGYAIVLALDFAYWYFRPRGIRGFLSTYLTYWYHWYSLKKADRIVSISEATKKDIVKLFPSVASEKIQTIYFGFRGISGAPQKPTHVPEKFFLFVGVFKERKNVLGVVQAFDIFLKTHQGYTLVLAGKAEGAYAEKVISYIREHGLERDVIMRGFVADAELSFLYKHAIALVFPSFIEGFGFPILEAMESGLPVITSNVFSLAEIGRDAALLIDPNKPEEIAASMARLADDDTLRDEFVARGLARAKNFSWDRTISEFMGIIKQK